MKREIIREYRGTQLGVSASFDVHNKEDKPYLIAISVILICLVGSIGIAYLLSPNLYVLVYAGMILIYLGMFALSCVLMKRLKSNNPGEIYNYTIENGKDLTVVDIQGRDVTNQFTYAELQPLFSDNQHQRASFQLIKISDESNTETTKIAPAQDVSHIYIFWVILLEMFSCITFIPFVQAIPPLVGKKYISSKAFKMLLAFGLCWGFMCIVGIGLFYFLYSHDLIQVYQTTTRW